jgi:Kef-type K+ transport system membrane component KefB
MAAISVCVTVFFVVGYGAAKRWLDPMILQLRKLTANEAVPSCILALVLVYAISAEWLGSVAGITGAYLLGYVFAESKFKADVERSFYGLGHGLLIPLFFVSIGLTSDYRALAGHWTLMFVILLVAVVGKLIGCGLAALASGMDWVRSLRIGCGMISRGEVGLIVTAMGASTGIFGRSEVAVMVTVVLLTTLLTPVALRGAFQLKSVQDLEEGLRDPEPEEAAVQKEGNSSEPSGEQEGYAEEPPEEANLKMDLVHSPSFLGLSGGEASSDAE